MLEYYHKRAHIRTQLVIFSFLVLGNMNKINAIRGFPGLSFLILLKYQCPY